MGSSAQHTSGKAAQSASRARAPQRVPGRTALPPVQALQAGAGNGAVSALLAGGMPLPPALRDDMESRFAADFAAVRIHDDSPSHAQAAALHAKAFTHGEHIVFSAERFAPQTGAGQRLLAHELAHVVQQRRGGAAPPLDAGAPHEQAADAAADAVASGQAQVSVAGATGVGVACDEDEGWGASLRRRYKQAKEYIPEEYREKLQSAAEFTADVAVDTLAVPLGPLATYEAHGTGSALLRDAQKFAEGDPTAGDELKGLARDKVQEGLGAAKGVATQVTEVVDTAMWIGGEYGDARDKAAEAIGGKKGTWGHTVVKRTMDALVTPLMPALPALAEASDQAKDAGLVDKDTGQASLTAPMSAKLNEWADDAEKAMGAAPRDPEMFSPMEKAEIASAIGTQVALMFVGAEEVKIAMNVIGALSGLRGIVETIRRSDNWKTDPRFWSSLIGMALSIVGLKHAKAASKITTLILKYGWVAAAIPPLSALALDYYRLETSTDLSDEDKRKLEARIKQNWGQAIHVLKDAILHVSQSRGGNSAKPPPEDGPPLPGPARKGGGTGGEEGGGAKPAAKARGDEGGSKPAAKAGGDETSAPPPVAAKADTPPKTTGDSGAAGKDATVVPIGAGKGKPQSNASKVLSQKLAKQPADQAGTVTTLPTKGKAGGPPPGEPAVQAIPQPVEMPGKIAVGQTHGADGGGTGPRAGGTVDPTVASLTPPGGTGSKKGPGTTGTGGGGTVTPIKSAPASAKAGTKPQPAGKSQKGSKGSASGKGTKAPGSKKKPAAKTPAKPPTKALPPDMEARLAALDVPPKQRAAFDKAARHLRKLAAKDPDAAESMLQGLEKRFGTPDLAGQVRQDQAEAGNKLYPEKGSDNKYRQSKAADERAALEQPRPTRKTSRKALVAESERKGVEGGTRQARKDGYTVSKNKSPQQFKEPFGRGPDAWGSKGRKRQLFEFKGESSQLGKGKDGTVQMSSKWAGKKIAELEVVGETKVAKNLLKAAEAGDLEGVVYRTKDTKGGEKSTKLKGHELRDKLGDDIVADDGTIQFDPAQVKAAYDEHKAALLKAKEEGKLRPLKNL